MTNKLPPKKIEGRVATILNATELVINVGAEHGVVIGQRFAILAETPIEVVDPTTDIVLDTIDREKVRVKVSEIREKISVCQTYRMKGGNNFIADYSKILSAVQKPSKETLRITDDSKPAPITEEESYVKINDRVISLVGDE